VIDPALVEQIETALLETRGGRQTPNGGIEFRCLNEAGHKHRDAKPSAWWSSTNRSCRACGDKGGALDTARRLGIPLPEREPGRETVYPIRDPAGALVAEHVRLDFPSGRRCSKHNEECTKHLWWRLPGTTKPGLGGRKTETLPLYGVHELPAATEKMLVVVTEGEKARDALAQRRILAVATVTGASKEPGKSIPSDDVLRTLTGFVVVLWCDADEPGRTHMHSIAARLAPLGIAHRMVDPWPDRTDGSDAADWRGTTDELREQLDAATEETRGSNPEPPPVSTIADGVRLVSLASITPASVRWAWEGRIPLGTVTLLVGDGGLGKSTMLLDVAARLSRGQLPGDLHGTPASVAVATAEDAVAEVVRPRAEAAGADLDRLHVVTVRRDGRLAGLVVPDDVEALRVSVRRHGVRLLIVDPLVAFLPETVNAHRDQHVRRALVPLVQLAEAEGIAVVAVVHLNKTDSTKVVTRICASVGFHNAARSVLLVGADPDDREGSTRVLVHAKCNLEPLAPSLRFRLEGRTVVAGDLEIQTSGVAWCGEAAGVSSDDVLRTAEPEKESATAEAMAWLREELAAGPVEQKTLVTRAKEALSISERTLQRARHRIGATTRKSDFSGVWVWALPETSDPKPPHPSPMSPLSPSSTSSLPQDDSTPPRRHSSSEDDKGGMGTRAREAAATSEPPPAVELAARLGSVAALGRLIERATHLPAPINPEELGRLLDEMQQGGDDEERNPALRHVRALVGVWAIDEVRAALDGDGEPLDGNGREPGSDG
jgi:AAA domain